MRYSVERARMNRLSFSRTQILILLSVWLTFLLSFVMRACLWASVMPILNEALHFTAKMGAQHISAFYFGYALTVLPGGILPIKSVIDAPSCLV